MRFCGDLDHLENQHKLVKESSFKSAVDFMDDAPQESPPVHGYDSDGEVVHIGSPAAQHPAKGARDRLSAVSSSLRLTTTRTRGSFRTADEEFVPVRLEDRTRKQQIRQ